MEAEVRREQQKPVAILVGRSHSIGNFSQTNIIVTIFL